MVDFFKTDYSHGVDVAISLLDLPDDVRGIIFSFVFDPVHPGCADLLLLSKTFKGRPVRKFSCGHAHCAFNLEDGRMFTFGANSFGQCGVNSALVYVNEPALVKTNVKHVECGPVFTLVITDGPAPSVYFTGAYHRDPVNNKVDKYLGIIDDFVKTLFHAPDFGIRCHTSGAALFDYGYSTMVVTFLNRDCFADAPLFEPQSVAFTDLHAKHTEMCGFGRCMEVNDFGRLVISTTNDIHYVDNAGHIYSDERLVVTNSGSRIAIIRYRNDRGMPLSLNFSMFSECKTSDVTMWKGGMYVSTWTQQVECPLWDSFESDTCAACFRVGRAKNQLREYNACCLLHRECAALCFLKSGVCPCGSALDTSTWISKK
jgi:hypothetical protein